MPVYMDTKQQLVVDYCYFLEFFAGQDWPNAGSRLDFDCKLADVSALSPSNKFVFVGSISKKNLLCCAGYESLAGLLSDNERCFAMVIECRGDDIGYLSISPILWSMAKIYSGEVSSFDATQLCVSRFDKEMEAVYNNICGKICGDTTIASVVAMIREEIPCIGSLLKEMTTNGNQAIFFSPLCLDFEQFYSSCGFSWHYSYWLLGRRAGELSSQRYFLDYLCSLRCTMGDCSSSEETRKKGEGALVAEYINSFLGAQLDSSNRINLLDSEYPDCFGAFLKEALSPLNMPLGKWPDSRKMSAMQQSVVNLATRGNSFDAMYPMSRITSVDAPLGIGKKEVIKNIVASNIVDKARLLLQYEDPDDLFEYAGDVLLGEYEFKASKHGEPGAPEYTVATKPIYRIKDDRITDLGIVVCSPTADAADSLVVDFDSADKLIDDLGACEQYGHAREGMDRLRAFFSSGSDSFFPDVAYLSWRNSSSPDLYFSVAADSLHRAIKEKHLPFRARENDRLFLECSRVGSRIGESCCEQGAPGLLIAAPIPECGEVDALLNVIVNVRNNERDSFKKARQQFKGQLNTVQSLIAKCQVETAMEDGMGPLQYFAPADNDAFLFMDAACSCAIDDQRLSRERELLLYRALQFTREFILESNCAKHNLRLLVKKNSIVDFNATYASCLMSAFNLLVPLISTTFEEVAPYLEYSQGKSLFGLLVVNDADMLEPQKALYCLPICRRALVMGGGFGLNAPECGEGMWLRRYWRRRLRRYGFPAVRLSIQQIANRQNPYGYIANDGSWRGLPLFGLTRCEPPILDICQLIMRERFLFRSPVDRSSETLLFSFSKWIDTSGGDVPFGYCCSQRQIQQVDKALAYMLGSYNKTKHSSFFVIASSDELCLYIRSNKPMFVDEKTWEYFRWNNVGTIGHFLDREADEALFVLDGRAKDKPLRDEEIAFAASRARRRLCVLGDYVAWKGNRAMDVLKFELDKSQKEYFAKCPHGINAAIPGMDYICQCFYFEGIDEVNSLFVQDDYLLADLKKALEIGVNLNLHTLLAGNEIRLENCEFNSNLMNLFALEESYLRRKLFPSLKRDFPDCQIGNAGKLKKLDTLNLGQYPKVIKAYAYEISLRCRIAIRRAQYTDYGDYCHEEWWKSLASMIEETGDLRNPPDHGHTKKVEENFDDRVKRGLCCLFGNHFSPASSAEFRGIMHMDEIFDVFARVSKIEITSDDIACETKIADNRSLKSLQRFVDDLKPNLDSILSAVADDRGFTNSLGALRHICIEKGYVHEQYGTLFLTLKGAKKGFRWAPISDGGNEIYLTEDAEHCLRSDIGEYR